MVKIDYLKKMRDGDSLDLRERILMILQLSAPGILAQLSTIVMEYIDSAMVGHMGSSQAASIGLVSSTTWLFGGLGSAFCIGYTVQIAQLIGAKKDAEARNHTKVGLLLTLALGLFLGLVGYLIAGPLPGWLGADASIGRDATVYFGIYALFMPAFLVDHAAGGMLQSSGNMKVPSFLHILMGTLNVIFNFFLIFPSREMVLFGRHTIPVFGFGMGVAGAALGTGLSELTVMILMLYFLLYRSEQLRIRAGERVVFYKDKILKALALSAPVGLESMALCSAYIMMTRIISPLGPASIAAHSFSITAEGLCYMPAYGISTASVTVIGQSIGAGRRDLTRHFAWLSMALGILFMTLTGGLMYLIAPYMIGVMTEDLTIRRLGTCVLRIEAFAEPFYGASIVGSGIFRGAKETLLPSLINLFSMWVVRLPLAFILSAKLGLKGAWIAMCIELIVRGVLYLLRLAVKSRSL